MLFKSPSNDGDWIQEHAVLPEVSVQGDQIVVRKLRDFRYLEGLRVSQARYLDQRYPLSELNSVWLGISHFGANGLAHVFLSFEFSQEPKGRPANLGLEESAANGTRGVDTNMRYLVVSIEARRLKNTKYNPFKGLFRAYTKIIVLGTEQDVIGVRSHQRGERVHLYRLQLSQLYSKTLLLNYLRAAESLQREPSFYNTLLDNCMTGLLVESHRYRNIRSWLDYRILLPGHADELAHEIGLIQGDGTLAELRDQSEVDPSRVAIEQADFSAQIRHSTRLTDQPARTVPIEED